MKKIIFTIAAILVAFTAASAQDNFMTIISNLQQNAQQLSADQHYKKAELVAEQMLIIYDTQPEEVQSQYPQFKADVYYDITRYRALQGNRKGAVEAFKNAIEAGWNDYAYTSIDSDLKPLRRNPEFQSLLSSIQ